MTAHHLVKVELDTRDEVDDHLVRALAAYRATAGRGPRGHVVVALTLPADDVVQAVQTAVALVAQAVDAPVLSVEALPADESDRRAGLDPVPRLLSVSEAASLLGVSRQAVLQRIESGSLPATRVGSTWAVPGAAVDEASRTSGKRREGLAAVAASWEGAGRWPQDDTPGSDASGPNPLDPLPLPLGAPIGIAPA